MRRALSSLLLLTAIAGAAACGGKDKKPDTLAGGGAGTPTDPGAGVGGGDPAAGGDTSGGTGGDPGGDPAGGGGGDTGGGAVEPGTPEAPAIVLPNLDPDPRQAQAAVDEHLRAARASLGGTGAKPDPDGAIARARQVLEVNPASVDAAVVIAHGYYLKGLNDTAEVLLDELFRRDAAKKNAGVYYVYGLVYEKAGKPKEAQLAYRTALQYDVNHASALTNLGIFQLRNKQYNEAAGTFERLTRQLGRTDANTYNALGAAYRGRAGDYPAGSGERDRLLRQAETAFKQAQTADRNLAEAYYNLGLLYLDADPFPADSGKLDTLIRLQRAKTYFDEYKGLPGADQTLYEERAKDVAKLIKREEKARKKAASAAAADS